MSILHSADPSRPPNLRVSVQRAVGGGILEARSLLRSVGFGLRGKPRPDKTFVIFGRGRSGSTLLVSLLDSHPRIACAGEVMRYRTIAPSAYIRRVLATGAAPVSGCKLLSYQMRTLHGMGTGTGFLRDLSAEGVSIIYLNRENLVRHAVSNIAARRNRVYHLKDGQAGRRARAKVNISIDEIVTWMEGSEQLAAYERAVLQDVPHLAISYERHLADSEAQTETLGAICDHFGLEPVATRSSLKKVTPENLSDIVENYEELSASLKQTSYGRFLD